MITFTLPNGCEYNLEQAVFDYNGTLAEDGLLTAETKKLLEQLTQKIKVTVLTADTFGLVRTQLQSINNIQLRIIEQGNEAMQKREFVRACGRDKTVCFGNGANDLEMFAEAKLSIGVIGAEGAHRPTLVKADVIVTSAKNAILLLLKPQRLVATLRS